MNYFTKLFKRFIRSKQDKNDLEGEPRIILELPQMYIYPNDLLEPFALAISCDSIKPVSLNINSIELYELKQQDGTFVGSCYVVKQENMYFGYIVGRKHIFSFSKNYFLMKKTSELWVPFKTDEDMIYSLICKYCGDEQNIIAICLVQTDKSSFENQTVLRSFSSDTDFFDALNESRRILEKN